MQVIMKKIKFICLFFFLFILNKIEIYNLDDKINYSDFTKANKLHIYLNEKMKQDREKIGIINARFVKINKNNDEFTYSIQLIPFIPDKKIDI